jgi:hypothetical protein
MAAGIIEIRETGLMLSMNGFEGDENAGAKDMPRQMLDDGVR